MVILANNNKITMVSRHGWFYGVQIHQFESLTKQTYMTYRIVGFA